MRFWVGLIAVVLGGCYSPAIDTCALACAGNACPSGFTCSNGRCAAEGSTCAPMSDGGQDAEDAIDAPFDSNSPTCGNHVHDDGEICFKEALFIPTQINGGVFDAQFVDADADMHLDLVYLTPTGFEFRHNNNNVFEAAVEGPRVDKAERFRAVNVNGQPGLELITAAKGSGDVQVFGYSGASGWTQGGQLAAEMLATNAIGVGDYTTATPLEFVVAYQNKIHLYRMSGGGALTFTEVGTGFQVADNIRDLASGDFDTNGRLELAVSTTVGISTYAIESSGAFTMFGQPNVPRGTSAVSNGDVDNDNDPDLFYVIPAVGGDPGQLGVTIWNQSNATWSLPQTQEIPKLFFPMDAADVDDDDLADAVIAFAQPNGRVQIGIARGTSTGVLMPAKVYQLDPAVQGVTQINVKEDFNEDGIPDIAITSSGNAQISILESDP